jgi:integrase/recombinase XerD
MSTLEDRSLVPSAAPSGAVELIDPLVRSYLLSLPSPKSRETQVGSIRRVAKVLRVPADRIPWADLDYERQAELRAALAARFPPATVNLTLACVRGVLKVGSMTGALPERLYHLSQQLGGVRGVRVDAGRALTDDEITALLDAAKGLYTPKAELLRALVLVGVETGMRREEMCRLSLQDFRGDDTVCILGKGNKQRICPLSTNGKRAVSEWLATREWLQYRAQRGTGWRHDRVFGSPRWGTPLQSPTLWRLLNELALLAKVEHFGPHDLRRTFATGMFRKDLELRQVQTLMGHESPTTTARYDKRAHSELTQRLKDVGGVYQPKHEARPLVLDAAMSERLRKLSPRVTDEDVQQATEMVTDAEGIAARLAAVKEKFGLR